MNIIKRIPKKFLLAVIFILSIILVVIVLTKVQEGSEELVSEDNGKVTIGYCADTMVIDRWQRDREIFEAKAKEKGYEVIVLNANEDNERQNEQIQYLIRKKVDVIVVIPNDKEGVADSIKDAKKAGIKVISYDRLILNSDIDAYISFDNEKVGELMASELYTLVPEGNYVIINGSPGDNNSYMFNQGYKNILQDHINSNDIVVIKEVWADDWREDIAYSTIRELLENNEQIDAIIGANDRLAEGAIRALTEYGLAGEVPVAGHDAEISACQRIVEGTQTVTVYKPIKTLAEAAVELAEEMIESNSIEAWEYINNGLYEVPFFKYNVILVTKNNIQETVIKDGFHREEDIYRNITN